MKPDDNVDLYKPDDTVTPGQTRLASGPTVSDSPPAAKPATKAGAVSWTAPEFIDHQRGAGWYMGLVVATAAVAALVYLLTKEYFATGTMVVLGVIVAIFAAHKPREVTCELSASGIQVGDKKYDYSLFKSFSVVHEGSLNSINLLPIKRLMSPVSVLFALQDQERIVKAIGEYLPYEERQAEGVERLTRRLRL